MGSRLDLHNELLKFADNVYYQPADNIQIEYPCIIYAKSDKTYLYGNDRIYLSNQGYQLTVIDSHPESKIADNIDENFRHCRITNYFTVEELHHVTLDLTW